MSAEEMTPKERLHQLEKYSVEQDKKYYTNNQLTEVAYCILHQTDSRWPGSWSSLWYKKFMDKPRTEQLAIAGALVMAQMDIEPPGPSIQGFLKQITYALDLEINPR